VLVADSCTVVKDSANGVGSKFGVGVGEARPEGPRAGVGFLGRDSQPTS